LYIGRSKLGPDLIFVGLDMAMEEVRERVKARHHGEEQAAELLEVNVPRKPKTYSFH
jgi:hypothetical protein